MHLLLAEDDKISRDLLRRIIESDSHTVTLAEDGEEAWKALIETPGAYDACVFDICMPTTGGMELIERMRAREDLKRIPVILCSAVSDRATVQQAVALGVTHYIVKPYSRALMNEKLRAIRAAQSAGDTFGVMEPVEIACRRLGIDAAVHQEMVATMLDDATDWAFDLRSAQSRPVAERSFIRGRGLKGSCLSIGLRGAASRIEVAEKVLQAYLDLGPDAVLPREAIDAALLELDREMQAVRARLNLPRPKPRAAAAAEAEQAAPAV